MRADVEKTVMLITIAASVALQSLAAIPIVVIPDKPTAVEKFSAEEWIASQDWNGKEDPCAVQVALDRIRKDSRVYTRETSASNWDRNSRLVIVVPDNPTLVEKSASIELLDAVRRMTGAELVITNESTAPKGVALYVGDTVASRAATNDENIAEWKYDEIFIKSVADGVVFTGHPTRGVLYAVNTWLEDFCGVRWWTPKESSYPVRGSLPISGIEHRYAPKIKYRETYYKDGFDANFKVRLKGNFTSLTRYLFDKIEFIPPEKGGNHRLYFFKGRRSAYHSFFEILPPDTYFDAHPEWYGFVTNGNQNVRARTQLCLTNPEMLAEFIKQTKRRLREDPTVDFISISQNDNSPTGSASPCACPNCIEVEKEEGGVHSGPIIRFANSVAEAIEKEFPNVRVDTFAYLYSRVAPKKTKARHNVIVRFCDIDCPVAVPMDIKGVSRCEEWMKELKEWGQAASGQLFIWDYVVNFDNYMLPHPNLFSLGPNVRIFAESGAVGIFEQGDALCDAGEFNRLRHWVLAHLLWDPSKDDIALINEFIEGYYGMAAAGYLRDYFRIVNCPARDTRSLVSCYHKGVDMFMLPSAVDAAWKSMVEAERAAKKEGVQFSERVRREKLAIDHAVILEWGRIRKLYDQYDWEWPFETTRAEAVRRWRNDCLSFGVVARKETTDKNEFESYCKTLMELKQ